MKVYDILIALSVPILLGFGFVIAKPAMQYFPPYLLMGIRFTIPALLLVWWFPLPRGLFVDLLYYGQICVSSFFEVVRGSCCKKGWKG